MKPAAGGKGTLRSRNGSRHREGVDEALDRGLFTLTKKKKGGVLPAAHFYIEPETTVS